MALSKVGDLDSGIGSRLASAEGARLDGLVVGTVDGTVDPKVPGGGDGTAMGMAEGILGKVESTMGIPRRGADDTLPGTNGTSLGMVDGTRSYGTGGMVGTKGGNS
jgi:hypothetical protein